MNIAIIGTGNVGSALAEAWARTGHRILLGVRDTADFKGQALLMELPGSTVHSIAEAARAAEVVVVAAVPTATRSIAEALGDVHDKVIIDAMNAVRQRPEPYATTTEALQHYTNCPHVVKCFNTTGFENLRHPVYHGQALDMFVAGDSTRGKQVARQLALDAGFAECYDFGGNDKFELLEQLALSWINLAILQGQGRSIGFKLVRR